MKIWEMDFKNDIWYYCEDNGEYYKTRNGELFNEDGEIITDSFTLDRLIKIELTEREPIKSIDLSPSEILIIIDSLKYKRDNTLGISQELYDLIEKFTKNI